MPQQASKPSADALRTLSSEFAASPANRKMTSAASARPARPVPGRPRAEHFHRRHGDLQDILVAAGRLRLARSASELGQRLRSLHGDL